MRQLPFGWTGVRVPLLGQGTWDLERGDRATVVAAVRQGLDLGMTHLDTAEMYGDGEVERIVGEAINGRRKDVFLVSKVLPENASYQGILEACERSLRRLGTDHLDLYLLHWESQVPFAETARAFQKLVEQGKTRFWGVSNFDVPELQRAMDVLKGTGQAIACNQVLYHPAQRYLEATLLPFCQQHGIAVVAYSPLGAGSFPSAASKEGKALAKVARARQATARQVALAFVMRAGAFAIPKAARPEHVIENAGAGELLLSAEEVSFLEDQLPKPSLGGGLPTA